HALRFESLTEVPYDAVAVGRGRVDRHEIVVVKIHAPGAEFSKLVYSCHRVERGPDELAEWIAPTIADGPKTEREFVGRSGLECGHDVLARLKPRATYFAGLKGPRYVLKPRAAVDRCRCQPRKYRYAARMQTSTRPDAPASRQFQLARVRRRSSTLSVSYVKPRMVLSSGSAVA